MNFPGRCQSDASPVYLQIDMEISAVLPGFSMQTKVSSNMELGQTVIVGEVPEFFGNIGIG